MKDQLISNLKPFLYQFDTHYFKLTNMRSHPIKLQDLIKIDQQYLWKETMSYIFCIEIVSKERWHVRLLLLGGCNQVFLVMAIYAYTYQWRTGPFRRVSKRL